MKERLQTPAALLTLSLTVLACGPMSGVSVSTAIPLTSPALRATEPQAVPQQLDTATPEATPTPEVSRWGVGEQASYSSDGTMILVTSAESDLFVFDAETLREIKAIPSVLTFLAAFTPDGKTISTVSYFNGEDGMEQWPLAMQQWDLASGNEIHSYPIETDQLPEIGLIAPDGKTLAMPVGPDTINLLDMETGQELHRLNVELGQFSDRTLAFSPDSKLLATPGWQWGAVALWDVSTGQLVRTLNPDPANPYRQAKSVRVAFSPDGTMLAVGALFDLILQDQYTVNLLDASSGERLRSFTFPVPLDMGGLPTVTIVFSPDGKLLAGGSALGITLFDVASGSELLSIETGDVSYLTFSPDGTRLISGSTSYEHAGSVRIWDTSTGAELAP
jgi:WD40 repeat protein